MAVALLAAQLDRVLMPGLGPDTGVVAIGAMGEAVGALAEAGGAQVMVTAALPPPGEVRSAAWLLEQGDVQEFLASHDVHAVVPFKTSRRLEQVAAELGIELLAARASTVRKLENKLQLPDIAAAVGVPAPRGVTATGLTPADALAAATAELPDVDTWIFQGATGFAGATTHLVTGVADLERVASNGVLGAGKLVEQLPGDTVALTGIVLDSESAVVLAPCTQLTGIPDLTSRPYASCGNTWAPAVPAAAAAAVRDAGKRIGHHMAHEGFRGMFGIDAVVGPDGSVTLIEINPRATASLTLTAAIADAVPGIAAPRLLEMHVAAIAGVQPDEAASWAAAWEAGWTDMAAAAAAHHFASVLASAPKDVRLGHLPADTPLGWRLEELTEPGDWFAYPVDAGQAVAAGERVVWAAGRPASPEDLIAEVARLRTALTSV